MSMSPMAGYQQAYMVAMSAGQPPHHPQQGQHMQGQHMQGQHMQGQHMQGQHMQGQHMQGQPMQGQHISPEHSPKAAGQQQPQYW
jgi:zinc/manganese transport system substrate-binding protein